MVQEEVKNCNLNGLLCKYRIVNIKKIEEEYLNHLLFEKNIYIN